MTEKPYKEYDAAQLFAEKRNIEEAITHFKRKRSDLLKDAGHSDWAYKDEDYLDPTREIDRLHAELDKVKAELLAKNRQPSDSRRSRGTSGNLVNVECDCRPPRRFRLAGRAYNGGPIICGNCNNPFKLI